MASARDGGALDIVSRGVEWRSRQNVPAPGRNFTTAGLKRSRAVKSPTASPFSFGALLAQRSGRRRTMVEVLFSTAMVMAIWGGGRLFLLVLRDR
jgi:hypothetical protein